jgi:nucleoside triphosphate diphosphatase
VTSSSQELLVALLEIMARLRDPQCGCPWDLSQTFATIAPYTLEEAYEVADAIERGDAERLRDELGDLLFQVVFHARMAEEQGWFNFADVARAICDKLVRRHPHVFSEPRASPDHATLWRRWEEEKERERAAAALRRGESHASVLADVPLALPALVRAAKLGKRAGRVGFDWPGAREVREKVVEEIGELDQAAQTIPGPNRPGPSGEEAASSDAADAAQGSHEAVFEELGDLLFAVANWGRHLHVEPETALRAANAKFEHRFACMEAKARERGLSLKALSPEEWDRLWRECKSGSPA